MQKYLKNQFNIKARHQGSTHNKLKRTITIDKEIVKMFADPEQSIEYTVVVSETIRSGYVPSIISYVQLLA